MSSGELLLRARGLEKRFDGADRGVLTGIDLDLRVGDRLAIVGPSGSGKSTLLYLLGLLDRPSAGTLSWRGQDVASMSDAVAAQVRSEQIGFVFQDHHLLPQCSAVENVLVPLLARASRTSAADRQRAEQLLVAMGLGDRLGHRPHMLSTGQRQRVAVARALVNQPSLVLADEPTGALDTESARTLVELLLAHGAQAALVVVTHDHDVAARIGGERRLVDGRLEPR